MKDKDGNEWVINPEWVAAGPKADEHLLIHPDAFSPLPTTPSLVSTPEQLREYAWKTQIAEQLIRNRIPERYRYEVKDWPEWKQLNALDRCDKAMTVAGAIIALVGIRGTGKTTIASQLVIRRLWRTHAGLGDYGAIYPWMPYRKLSDLIARYKPLYADYGSIGMDELESARKALVAAPLLIIDEVGEGEDSKIRQKLLTDLLDRRYSAMTDTLLISNQEPKPFCESVGQSVVSRISECGAIIECKWASFRDK